MANTEASKVVLEKQTLKQKLKSFTEVKTIRKSNVPYGLGKGKVNIISKHGDDLDPKLYESELKGREKRDKQLDDLHVLKAKNEAEEVAEKEIKDTPDEIKAMFPEWTVDRI